MTQSQIRKELEYLYRAEPELQRRVDELGAQGRLDEADEAWEDYLELCDRIDELREALNE